MPTDAMLLLTPTSGPPTNPPWTETTVVVHESAGGASRSPFDWSKLAEMVQQAAKVSRTWSSEVEHLKTNLAGEKNKNEHLNINLAEGKDKNEHLNINLDVDRVSSASSAHSGGEVATSATPTATASLTPAAAKVAPTTVVVAPTPPATIGTTTWSQMLAEGRRLLEAGAREAVAEIEQVNARAVSADGRVAELEQELKVTREDLQNMKELVAGNELQRRGLEKRMSNMEDHLASVRDSLRKSFTSLHQLAGACGVRSEIPVHSDETSVALSLYDLAEAMEVIPFKHAAKVSEEIANGVYTGACYVLACVKLAHPDLDLQEILSKGAADATHKDVMSDVAELGETVSSLYEE